jgi:uncharacterized SAM-binding protein YcdF (DUF218 family)
MLELTKALYSFVAPPGLWVVLAAVLSVLLLFRDKKSSCAAAVLALLLYAGSTSIVADSFLRTLEDDYTPQLPSNGDVIVVLTGGAVSGAPDTDGVDSLNGHSMNRIVAASELHRRLGLPVLISGGQVFPDSANEGHTAKRKLISLGVKESDIMLDDTSRNTKENARNSAAIIKDRHLQNPILVTSAFHMRRAVQHFAKQGVAVTPYPTDYVAAPKPSLRLNQFLPSAGAVQTLSMALKEYLGLLDV